MSSYPIQGAASDRINLYHGLPSKYRNLIKAMPKAGRKKGGTWSSGSSFMKWRTNKYRYKPRGNKGAFKRMLKNNSHIKGFHGFTKSGKVGTGRKRCGGAVLIR